MAQDETELHMWRIGWISMTLIVLGVLGFLTSCGIESHLYSIAATNAETARVTACVENGGQWLRIPNLTNVTQPFECRSASVPSRTTGAE